MSFIDFELITRDRDSSMPTPHSHDFYELYFLLDGKRTFFIGNKMFNVESNTLVVVPPYVLHKTEGTAFKRVNVNFSPDILTKAEAEFLNKTCKLTAVKLSKEYRDVIYKLVMEGATMQSQHLGSKAESQIALGKAILVLLSLQESISLSSASISHKSTDVSPEVLKIVYYINTHYDEDIKLADLCDIFHLSKAALCKKFKEVMNCSIMKYVLELRLNKAKALLRDTNKSIEKIADTCGFSSANYFGLIFKKAIGLSPLNFRKSR